jgi:DNA-binding transcriptional regulator of glucitol operon
MRRFLSPRWIARHVAMIVLVVAFFSLGWWQIGRAEGGNALSYGYAFEWPVFALFVIFVWYREIRGELGDPVPKAPKEPEEPALRATVPLPARPAIRPDPADPELNEYNDYLAWLNANPDRKPADYRQARVAAADTPIRISDRRPE